MRRGKTLATMTSTFTCTFTDDYIKPSLATPTEADTDLRLCFISAVFLILILNQSGLETNPQDEFASRRSVNRYCQSIEVSHSNMYSIALNACLFNRAEISCLP